jgi:V-type H+-transporting ATPase subunit a
MPRENAYDIFNALGQLGIVEVNDCDPTLPLISRPFANYIKRCDDLLFTIDSIIQLATKLDQNQKLKRPNNYDHVLTYFQSI